MIMSFSRSIAMVAIFSAALSLAPAFGQSLSSAQKQDFEHLIHDYIVNHPEVITEALQALRARAAVERAEAASAAIDAHRDQLLNDPDSPVGGNPKGDVTLVEFFDYRCPYCKKFEPELEALIKAEPNLRLVYKEYPILGPESIVAARVALAARRQGKYDEFHRAMLNLKGPVTDAVIFDTAKSVGIDVGKVKADMNTPAIDDTIKHNLELAAALKVNATPTFVIGNTVLPGAINPETLHALIAAQRQISQHQHG